MTELKVYAWLGFRPQAAHHTAQTREIIAVPSRADAAQMLPAWGTHFGPAGNHEGTAVPTHQ